MRRICLLALLATCGTKHGPEPARRPIADQALVLPTDVPAGLDIHLSTAKAGPPRFDPTAAPSGAAAGRGQASAVDPGKLAPAQPLPAAEAEQLLKRAPALQAATVASVAIRPASTPPPRTGAVVPMAANHAPPPTVTDKQLRVLRYQPEGKVPIAPELAITFSQPMIAVTSQDDAAKVVPVTLRPQPAGQWRWVGTRTLLFDPQGRFPQATSYRVDIAKGTASAVGGNLGEATSFTFETPPPTLVASSPSGIAKLDPAMFAMFDQRIDPAAVLAHVVVRANGVAWPVELVAHPDKQLQAVIDAAVKNEQAGRFLAFHPTRPFPRDAAIDVELAAGTPSAEGPNPTVDAQRFAFHTFPPLAVAHAECGWNHECRPSMPFRIETTTALDEDRWNDASVTVTPAIADLRIAAGGAGLTISGSTAARTTYRVTLAGAIRDVFGQTLERDVALTFTVGDAEPAFWGPDRMVVLDPAARARTLDFFTTSYSKLDVQLYRVAPADLGAYLVYQRNRWNHDHPPVMPGTKVFDGRVNTAGGELAETRLDLTKALDGHGRGMAVAIVAPSPWKQTYEQPRLISWIQATSLALDAHVDGDQLVAYVSELATGAPIADADVELLPGGQHVRSDGKGLATFALAQPSKGASYLVASKAGDAALLVDESSWYNEQGTWSKQPRPVSLAWYATPDRFLYKPGEEVSFKGWVRNLDLGKGGDVGLVDVGPITYRAFDANRVELAKGTLTPNAMGGFDGKIALPKTPNLGYAWIQLTAANGTHNLGFQIEEFRRPEFEVGAKASQGPFVVGGSAEVTATAKYYSGGPLPGAPVSWYVSATPTTFTPPNRDAYIFGQWRPWWGWDGDGSPNATRSYSFADKTDATGAQTLHLDFLSARPALPMAVTANASITDVNRQQWSASAPVLVHPATVYVGLKPEKPFVDKGTPFPLEVIAVDLDGKQVQAKLDVRAARLEYKYAHGEYKATEVEPQACDPARCSFATPKGGEYRITATVVDDKGRANQTIMTFWVSGGERAPARDAELEKVTLIPDRKLYAPGDTAEVLVQSPFSPAEAIVTWRRGGIVKLERVHLDGPTTKLSVPIAEGMTPGIYVAVDLVGAAVRATDAGDPDPKLPKRPAFAAGELYLEVPPVHRTLAVTVAPAAAKVGPGEKTKISVEVKDAAGHPVANADTVVIVVDEAILALSGAQFASPIATFYPNHGAGVRDTRGRTALRLARPDSTILVTKNEITMAPPPPPAPPGTVTTEGMPPKKRPAREINGLAEEDKDYDGIPDEADRSPDAPIAVRQNFNPLAAWAPQVKTDAQGRATVAITMPDNLTRYRIVAIAAAGKQFGKGESALTARLPLMVRPSPPRFLNFGDKFALPIVVQNQTDAAMTVKVAARASNAVLTDAGRIVTVPANDRVELELAAAAELPGTARFQVLASAGSASDAAEVALPVWTPATTEAFATYGTIESGAIAQPVQLPGAVVPGYGGLEITAASTQLQSLTDAVIYLARYPFECAEQRSSRIAAIASLRDVLAAFHAKELPSKGELEASVKTDIEHLSQMQNSDGGFAYWDRGYPSEPYLSVYVAGALGKAKAKGFTVDGKILGGAIAYMKNIPFPAFYSKEVRWAIRAYALDVRRQLGDRDLAGAKALYGETFATAKTTASLETAGWLLATLAGDASAADERKALVRYILNRASETAGAASFAAAYGDGNYLILASDRRVDAVLLDALLAEQPRNDLIPKLVTGLLGHRVAGHWLSTQENAFALGALDSYFHAYEAVTPDFVARVWLGSDGVGEHRFVGRTTESAQLDVAMADVARHDKQRLVIAKAGAGRLYYRIGLTYAPASLALAPADRGFVVQRRYEAVDDPKDVVRAADGTWKVKAGARVRVRVTMVNEARRYHVALVDPMPAGFEAMNPALATTGPIPTDPKANQPVWWGPWYEHQNLRDERVEAFAALLWEGTHEYAYVARATTTGAFVVPPPKAEEMYMPETFGRGGTDRVVIE